MTDPSLSPAEKVSIHAPREGCDVQKNLADADAVRVSIHAPREGCDFRLSTFRSSFSSFNSRTPGGVRLQRERRSRQHHKFQFTHPGRGATSFSCLRFCMAFSFNSRTPGGVRRLRCRCLGRLAVVSIHAPREGCDWLKVGLSYVSPAFQFTHPGRGATIW